MKIKIAPARMNAKSIIKLALPKGADALMPAMPITASVRNRTTITTAITRLVRLRALGIHEPRIMIDFGMKMDGCRIRLFGAV
jgi:hypothetical protein